MEINEKKLVQILKEQRTEFQQYVDSKFKIVDKRSDQTDKKLEQVDRRLDQVDQGLSRTDKRLEQVDRKLDQVDKRFELNDSNFQRYLGVVAEDFASKFNLLAESIAGVQEQLIAIRDMVAKNTEDIEIIKMDISFMKHELKRKVDQDEFGVLEKRVLLLEKKLARV
ncbi:MAG: hypothetical protein COY09_01705 [Candidatus Portnoybacteria bacterium CG_4_10_14_0_2_um_filter_39_11]|uniref:t-SNARE coiled-coil homology domain-containing protein n=2 Tax=Candidatus Portnoyibacteriota TaxID=1817913 RepID=A0A2M7UIG3_9BACT|nr:MAG: hypothetical protein AUJ33_02735 [Parcubacteria group bacterium CG1_02_40_25]PIZ70997.1 MAG: hypothetical protein COY09_01705 [Candidatus Portnoybacteria bacterium CG_4_10_14_0_2_um_filter_39_11]